MPTALEEFTVAGYYPDGAATTVAAGEIVADRHEFVRRFPNRFGPDFTPYASPPRKASAWRGTATPPGLVRQAPERYKVEVTRWAHYDLDLALGEFDGLEIGGGLFGHVDGDTIVVEHVSKQAPGRDRTTSHTEISLSGCMEFARSYDTTWLGDWHVHPGVDSGSPSDTDVRSWQGLRRAGSPWLGLILTSGPDPIWAMCGARYHPWVVTDQGLKAASLQQQRS
jgi:hypothetical protein